MVRLPHLNVPLAVLYSVSQIKGMWGESRRSVAQPALSPHLQNFVGFCPGAKDQALCFSGSPYLEPALNGPQKLVRILARVLLLQALHKFAPCPPWLGTIPGVELICDSHDRVGPAPPALGL